MLFLAPVFQELEEIFLKYAPQLYKDTLVKVTRFLRSGFLLYLVTYFRGASSCDGTPTIFNVDILLVDFTVLYQGTYWWRIGRYWV